MTHAYLVAGLAFGDEGKGFTVDRLVRETGAKLVVRYNGGPQAAHNVVTADGRHHCFSQFGSGSFHGAGTYLSRFMLIEPFALLNEAATLQPKLDTDPLAQVQIETGCPVITPFHWLGNRIKETARNSTRHGSCGFGVGELRADQTAGFSVLNAGDLRTPVIVRAKLASIRERKMAEVRDLCSSFEAGALFEKMFKENIDYLVAFYSEFAGKVRIVPDDRLKELFLGPVVFEGAQGMLLDETWGFAPHNSWTDITFTNALKLIKGISIPTSRIGVLRTHFTRHGAGPFPTEDPAISFQDHNTVGPWQGAFRFGRFDLVLARYALEKIGGVDEIVLTHQDCLPDGVMEFHDCYEVATECFTRLHLPDTELLTMARPGPIRRATPESVCHMRLGIPIRKG